MAAEKTTRGGLNPKTKPVSLSTGLERRLTAYASAAIAAGASLAALAPRAEAEIVYTPANTVIKGGLNLDLNHDGLADFVIAVGGPASFDKVTVSCAVHQTYRRSPKGMACNYLTNQVWGRGVASGRFASALPAGFPVGPNKSYFQAAKYPFAVEMGGVGCRCTSSGGSFTGGQWLSTENRYLGLQFVIKGEVHYGWARLNVGFSKGRIAATLTGYAYETIPNKPIITGKTKGADVTTLEPATLGHLAQGASQIQAWRSTNK